MRWPSSLAVALFVGVHATIMIPPAAAGARGACWKDCPIGTQPVSKESSSCRGMLCQDILEPINGQCYWPCRKGYVAEGLTCKQTACPRGYTDLGSTCKQTFVIVGKKNGTCPGNFEDLNDGTCRRQADTRIIERRQHSRVHVDVDPMCPEGLEESSFDVLCYDRCRDGFTGQGPLCIPNGKGAEDEGTYARGPGSELVMPSMDWCTKDKGYEMVGALCMIDCGKGFRLNGDMCVKDCPQGWEEQDTICVKEPQVIDKASLKSYTREVSQPPRLRTVKREPCQA